MIDLRQKITPKPQSPTSQVRIDQRVVKNSIHCCNEPNDVGKQILCIHFLYNSVQTLCTFNRFDYGVCDYTPESYNNVVKFNAYAKEKKGK